MKVKTFSIKNNGQKYNIYFEYQNKSFIFSCTPKKRCMLSKNFSEEYNTILCKKTYQRVMHYLYINSKGDLMLTSNTQHIMNIKQRLIVFPFFSYFIILGKFPSVSKNFDEIFIDNISFGKIKRFPFFKKFGFIKLNVEKIIQHSSKFHSPLWMGNEDVKTRLKFIKSYSIPFCFFGIKYSDKYVLIRTQANSSNLFITVIPFSPLYSIFSSIKMSFAHLCSHFFKKTGVVLYEKLASQAEESGIYVFEKIMQRTDLKETAYFILDESAPAYLDLKKKYPSNILPRFSFKHFFEVFRCRLLMSSEFPPHVFTGRVFKNCLIRLLKSKEWVFLQHGIMFAKPIENPMGKGFYKKNLQYNMLKVVVSSDLESGEFLKAGYSVCDLIKCGLPKFDVSRQQAGADKILFMPTYRFWEEALVLHPKKIVETTYFKLYEKIIEEFKKRNLFDRLLLAAHRSLADALKDKLDISDDHFPQSINAALEQACIFITNFSSASYDAHYRGAYIIYYWEERAYLEKNYQAVAPINAQNCDGIPVYSIDALFKEIDRAVTNSYRMPLWCEENYKKINEFHDNNNADRLIDSLKEARIIY